MNIQQTSKNKIMCDWIQSITSAENKPSKLISLCNSVISLIELNAADISAYDFFERNFLVLHLNELKVKIDNQKKINTNDKYAKKLNKTFIKINNLNQCISSRNDKDAFTNNNLPIDVQTLIFKDLKLLYEKNIPNHINNSNTSFPQLYNKFLPTLKMFYNGNKKCLYSDIIPKLMTDNVTSQLFCNIEKNEIVAVYPHLKSYNVLFNSMSEALAEITALLPSNKLKSLTLTACTKLTDQMLTNLITKNNGIEELNISLCSNITNLGFKEIHQLSESLNSLNFSNNSNVTDENQSLRILSKLKKLSTLNVKGCKQLGDELIDAIKHLPIQDLNMSMCNISNIGIEQLIPCATRTLEYLSLLSCSKTNIAGINSLLAAQTTLKELRYYFCTTTGIMTEDINQIKNFEKVKIITHSKCWNTNLQEWENISDLGLDDSEYFSSQILNSQLAAERILNQQSETWILWYSKNKRGYFITQEKRGIVSHKRVESNTTITQLLEEYGEKFCYISQNQRQEFVRKKVWKSI